MRVLTHTFWLPKKGNASEEYEDAAAPAESVDQETAQFRCAVADGATETSFSGYWAKLLVDAYVEQKERTSLKGLWSANLAEKSLAWYAEQKAESGAYAALVGLTINDVWADAEGGSWDAEAVGDCCLLQVRDNKVIECFPLMRAEQFNNSPYLIASNFDEAELSKALETKSGLWRSGDTFYLLSDAIARWAYAREEEHKDAANWLNIISQSDLEALCDVQRNLTDSESIPSMRNDDVTLLRLHVSK